jgi:hypothetical protein
MLMEIMKEIHKISLHDGPTRTKESNGEELEEVIKMSST